LMLPPTLYSSGIWVIHLLGSYKAAPAKSEEIINEYW